MVALISLTRTFTTTCQDMGSITMSLLYTALRQVVKQKHRTNKSRTFCRRRSTRWGLHGRIDYTMHYGLIEWPTNTTWDVTISTCLWKDQSSTCWARIQSSLGHQAIEHGLWSYQNQEEDATLWAWWMAWKKHFTTPKFTRREQKDGMTRGSKRRSSPPEIRYYFLILGLNYSGTKNFGANGKDKSSSLVLVNWWSPKC